MRSWRFEFAHAMALVLLAGWITQPALAQRGVGQGKGKGQHRAGESAPRAEGRKNAQREMRGMVGLPPRWMEKLREMPPDEQERFLSNNERFKNLPPERQAQIRRRLQKWNSLTPEQQRAVHEREEVWRQISPEQQRRVREEILPKWQQLPPERRQVIMRHLRALRDMSASERAAKLNDEAFLQGLNPDERVLLRELSNLRGGPPPEPAQENP